MKLKKKKEAQSMDILVLFGRGTKIPLGGDTERKSGLEADGQSIKKLPHLGFYPIYSYQTQTLWMPTSVC